MKDLYYELQQLISMLKENNKLSVAQYFEKILNSRNIDEYLEPLKNSGAITQYANFNKSEFDQLAKIQKIAVGILSKSKQVEIVGMRDKKLKSSAKSNSIMNIEKLK